MASSDARVRVTYVMKVSAALWVVEDDDGQRYVVPRRRLVASNGAYYAWRADLAKVG